ncbi:hypothetical protein QFC19_002668 [Naganishia cerealis]|uniref:Uncharacterized protein n=1 Tax=Naganishia cerealis TaxID=610337 RepID=A0ACC2WA14_9TREE|nr:hypothetical protein QFC19_002668 [Naganishia cerealis]
MQHEEPSLSLIKKGLKFPEGSARGDGKRYKFLKETINDLLKNSKHDKHNDYSLLTKHRDHGVREDYLLMYAVCVAKVEDSVGYYENVVLIVHTLRDDCMDDKRKIVESIPFKVYFATLKEVMMMGESKHVDPERLQVFDVAGSSLFQDCDPDWEDIGNILEELRKEDNSLLQLTPSGQWDISMHGRRTYSLFNLLDQSSNRSVSSSSQLSEAQGSRSERTSLFADVREFNTFVVKRWERRKRRFSELQRCEPGKESSNSQLSSHSGNSAVSYGTGSTGPAQHT